MNSSLVIDQVRCTRANRHDRKSGLLAFVALRLNGCLQLDGIALRRTAAGHLALSFPQRLDCHGRAHPLVRPLDDTTRREIERQVFEALELGVEANG